MRVSYLVALSLVSGCMHAEMEEEGSPSEESVSEAIAPTVHNWNPGHYLIPGGPHKVDASVGWNIGPAIESVTGPWNDNRILRGLQIRYLWPDIEPTADNYAFITNVMLEHLRACKEKKLRYMALIALRTFSSDVYAVPAYARGPAYGGGEWATESHHEINFAHPAVRGRFQKMMEKIAVVLENDPAGDYFEGVFFTETATKFPDATTLAQKQEHYAGWIRMQGAVRKLFRRAFVCQWMNFPQLIMRDDAYDMANAMIGGLSTKVGIGGPDVFVRDGATEDLTPPYDNRAKIYQRYAEHAGKVPICPSVQQEDFVREYHPYKAGETGNPRDIEIAELHSKAVRKGNNYPNTGVGTSGVGLHSTHVVWFQRTWLRTQGDVRYPESTRTTSPWDELKTHLQTLPAPHGGVSIARPTLLDAL